MFTITKRNPGSFMSYDPFREMEEMRRMFFSPAASGVSFGTDIKDNGDSYLLQADLPGFGKDDIHVDVDGDRLTISAERNTENEEKDEKDNYIRRERSYGSYVRSFDISEIDADAITASYTDGVLTLELPKLAPRTNTARRIELN